MSRHDKAYHYDMVVDNLILLGVDYGEDIMVVGMKAIQEARRKIRVKVERVKQQEATKRVKKRR